MVELNLSNNKELTDKSGKDYEAIRNKLLDISSKLKHIKEKKDRIKLIIHLNDVLIENENVIKTNFSDVLVSILNSI